MVRAKQDKYIDLSQFVHKNGKISWNDNIGVIAEFFYNGERHTIEILSRVNKDYLKIKVDDIIIDKAHTTKITKLTFDNMFYKPDYLYNVGDIVNELIILEQCISKRKTKQGNGIVGTKSYKVKCIKDGYEFISDESNLNGGHGCPVCSRTIVVKGINDIATTDPDLIKFFVDTEEAYKHSRSSDCRAKMICPYCGHTKYMRIAELSKYGYVTCDKCSDGISYPNKFAHELFNQLNSQYSYYEYEYSPDWANDYRYDNYIELSNGRKIIIEMDGGYHYLKTNKAVCINDVEKDNLCKEHNIEMIRIDCNYVKTHERYDYIKSNIIDRLSDIFDLSSIDWDKCNEVGLSNYLFEVIEHYKNNPYLGLNDIAKYFKISMGTMYSYLYMGEELGLCNYVRADSNRIKNSKPIAMYDMGDNLIGIYKSGKVIEEAFPEKQFRHRSIRKCATNNKSYKDYIFKYVTYEEYYNYLQNKQSENVA